MFGYQHHRPASGKVIVTCRCEERNLELTEVISIVLKLISVRRQPTHHHLGVTGTRSAAHTSPFCCPRNFNPLKKSMLCCKRPAQRRCRGLESCCPAPSCVTVWRFWCSVIIRTRKILGWQECRVLSLKYVAYLGQRTNEHGWIHTESNTTIPQVHCICCLPPPPSFLFIVSEDVGGMASGRLCAFVSLLVSLSKVALA
jgi:hypothetical protein